jgi:hypothetical protein
VRVKDSLPDRHSALVGWLPRHAARVDRCLLALSAAVVPRTALYAGCQAFCLLHVRLLNESLCLVVQVSRLECRGRGHGSEQHCHCNELLTHARRRAWVVTLKSALMRSWAYLPSSCTHLPCVLMLYIRIKVHMDLQADKSPVVVKGPFSPRVVNPRYRIRGTMCNVRIQSSKARKAIL